MYRAKSRVFGTIYSSQKRVLLSMDFLKHSMFSDLFQQPLIRRDAYEESCKIVYLKNSRTKSKQLFLTAS